MKTYEEEIIKKWRSTPQSPMFAYSAVSPKAAWIRGYLLERGEGYQEQMWRSWQSFIKGAHEKGAHIRVGSERSFATYIWVLKKLNLITPTRREINPRKSNIKRQYYRLNPDKIDSPAWKRPFQVLYPASDSKLRKKGVK